MENKRPSNRELWIREAEEHAKVMTEIYNDHYQSGIRKLIHQISDRCFHILKRTKHAIAKTKGE